MGPQAISIIERFNTTEGPSLGFPLYNMDSFVPRLPQFFNVTRITLRESGDEATICRPTYLNFILFRFILESYQALDVSIVLVCSCLQACSCVIINCRVNVELNEEQCHEYNVICHDQQNEVRMDLILRVGHVCYSIIYCSYCRPDCHACP